MLATRRAEGAGLTGLPVGRRRTPLAPSPQTMRPGTAFAAVIALAAACTPAEPEGTLDGGLLSAAGGPYVLRVTNAATHTLYVQDSSGSGPAVFALSRGVEPLPIFDRCEMCPCGTCSCAVCGVGVPIVEELAPGESFDQPWSGIVWRVKPSGCDGALPQCEQEELPPSGSLALTATYSASATVDPALGGTGSLDPPLLTRSVTLELPSAAKIFEILLE